MNLLCAVGLRGSEALNLQESLERLDGLARRVKHETDRHHYQFRERPAEFRHSEPHFKMLYLLTVLQEDLGIRYNPERITPVGVFESNAEFFEDSRDVFIHGLIDDTRRMGTCSSLPVLYVAVGRRLGYPLKLVPTKNHLFIRWEDERARFNVDATGLGFSVREDVFYRNWPFPVSVEEERAFHYLQAMTSAEELRAFLAMRGHCLFSMGCTEEAFASHEAALRFAPHSLEQQMILATARKEHQVALRLGIKYRGDKECSTFDMFTPTSDPVASEWRFRQIEKLNRQRRGEPEPVLPTPQEQAEALLPPEMRLPSFKSPIPVTRIPDPNPLLQLRNQGMP